MKIEPVRVSCLAWFLLAYLLGLAQTDLRAAEPASVVRIEDGKLWVAARNTPLIDILKSFAQAADFELTVSVDLSEPVSVTLNEVALEVGFNELTKDCSKIVQLGSDAQDDWRPRKIWVLGRSERSSPPRQASAAENPRSSESMPGTQTLESLFKQLDHPHSEIRIATVLQLSGLHSEAVVTRLGETLRGDAEPAVRRAALEALVEVGNEQAFDAATAGMSDKQASLRRQAMHALYDWNSAKSVPFLGQLLFRDTDAEVRLDAVNLLGATQHPAARVLLGVALQDRDERVRKVAANYVTFEPAR